MARAGIILAAGKGTRMNSDIPKVLHPVAGAPLLHHAMGSLASTGAEAMVVVTGDGAKAVTAAASAFDDAAICVLQDEQLGTGHAVAQARAALDDFTGDTFVLFGDTPFIRPETLDAMADARCEGHAVIILGFEAATPGGYARLVMNSDNGLERIVEAKDAIEAEKTITLCNSGVLCADRETLFSLVAEIGNDNAAGEYYLTEIVEIARARGLTCGVVICDEEETLGVNSRVDLASAEATFQTGARKDALLNGATMTAPDTVFLSHDTVIGRDVMIEPHVVFGPGVTVESGATIRAFSHLEGCHVSKDAIVGPYARLRPGAEIGDKARVGNFVEVKAALVGEGAKLNHLSYIGDATVGEAANIGAGTITCNYDGVSKHQTEIGARAFVGSNTALVAPVQIGADTLIGSGSVITRDVPDTALAVSRAEQQTKPGLAVRLFKKLRAQKAKGDS